MPTLKDLRNRIASVKATQKITKAMQMVAAAKLRRPQATALPSAPHAGPPDKVASKPGEGGRAGARGVRLAAWAGGPRARQYRGPQAGKGGAAVAASVKRAMARKTPEDIEP